MLCTGLITVPEIQEVLESVGYNYSNEEVEEMVTEVDLDGDGAIDFEEFEQIMEQVDEPKELETEEVLRQAFCSSDGDSDGFISEYELREVRDSLGMDIDDDELHELIDSVDDDGDGSISYNQFIEIMSNR